MFQVACVSEDVHLNCGLAYAGSKRRGVKPMGTSLANVRYHREIGWWTLNWEDDVRLTRQELRLAASLAKRHMVYLVLGVMKMGKAE